MAKEWTQNIGTDVVSINCANERLTPLFFLG